MSPYFKMDFFKRASKGFYGYRPTNSLVTWLGTSITLLIVGGVLSLLRWDWFAVSWDWLNGDESNSATIRNIGLVVAGLVALPLAIWRAKVADRQASAAQRQVEEAQRQVDTAQEGLLNERYQKGAEMLGSNVLTVRMGGIYALQQLAHDHAGLYHVQIMNLFCAFVRRPVLDLEATTPTDNGLPALRQDVQAIVDAITARTLSRRALEREVGYRLDLRGSNLAWAVMDTSFHFAGQRVSARPRLLSDPRARIDLEFSAIDLSYAQLEDANLSYARLNGADLSGARLFFANLSNAELIGANLSDGASLIGTNLSEAWLQLANLSNATFDGTNLSGADLYFEDVDGDDSSPAKGITQAMLDEAIADPNNPPKLGGVVLDAETGEPLVWRGEARET